MRNVSKCFYAVDVVLKFITGYKRLKAKSTISLPKFLISLLIGLQFQSKIFHIKFGHRNKFDLRERTIKHLSLDTQEKQYPELKLITFSI